MAAPGDNVTISVTLRPRLDWAEGRTGVVLVSRGKRTVVRILAASGVRRPWTLKTSDVTVV